MMRDACSLLPAAQSAPNGGSAALTDDAEPSCPLTSTVVRRRRPAMYITTYDYTQYYQSRYEVVTPRTSARRR